MDYFIKGRINARTVEELELFMEVQERLNQVQIKTGRLIRYANNEGDTEFFSFEARTTEPTQAKTLYDEYQALMQGNDISGWMGWHECRHDEGDGMCEFTENFIWPILAEGGG